MMFFSSLPVLVLCACIEVVREELLLLGKSRERKGALNFFSISSKVFQQGRLVGRKFGRSSMVMTSVLFSSGEYLTVAV